MMLATFWDNYGLIIILIAVCVAMMVFYYIKHRKQENDIQEFEDSLKAGDRVKTYSGFYGEISNITLIKEDNNQVKIVTLKLGSGSFIDVDIRAIAQIDKREVAQQEQTLDAKVAELRLKEDLAKRDQTKANTATFRPANQPKVEENKEEQKVEQEKNVEKPVVQEQNLQEEQPKPEHKRFVAKPIERRSFSSKPKTEGDSNGDDTKKWCQIITFFNIFMHSYFSFCCWLQLRHKLHQ